MDTKPVNVFETDSMAISAYLLMKGVKMARHIVGSRKTTWYFEDAPAQGGMTKCQTLHTEFLNSDCKRYDSFIRDLKKTLRNDRNGHVRD